MTHDRWLGGLVFEQRAAAVSFADYRAALAERDATLAAIEADWWPFAEAGPFAECVHRRGAYRGIARLGALMIASEVIDWRRFARGASFRDFTGLVPSEHSSGEATRRGQITKTGNTHLRTQLVESAWASQHGPAVGVELRKTPAGPAAGDDRPGLGRTAAAVPALPRARCPQEHQRHPRRGHRPRAGRVLLGRDDRHHPSRPHPRLTAGPHHP